MFTTSGKKGLTDSTEFNVWSMNLLQTYDFTIFIEENIIFTNALEYGKLKRVKASTKWVYLLYF